MTRPLRLAVATRCFAQPLKSALLLASQFGATGVQLDARNETKPSEMSATGRRQFTHLLAEVGLAVASLDFPLRRPLWDIERLDARIEALKETMEFAYQLKARTVTVRLGGLPDESDKPGLGLLQTVLNDLARHGNRVGVMLAVGQGREPAPRLVEVLRTVTEGPIGVNFDPAAAMTSETSPAEALQGLGDLVAHVMVRDATRDFDGNGREVPVGRGEVPWVELLALLQEMNYRGWLTVDRTQGEDRAGDAGRAIQFLKSVYRG
jgi:sugar phosphate isomerase/epimerase